MKKLLLGTVAAVFIAALAIYFLFPGVLLGLAQRGELRAAGLERKEIDVAGHHVVYLEGGSGEPLLLLHGFGADSGNWVRMARTLTPRLHVVAPDLPGFGQSTRDPSAHYGVADQVERVHALAAALGLGPVHLGGNSMGGAIAGAYAARYPQEIKTLWLLAPGSVHAAEPSEVQQRFAKGENPFHVETAMDFQHLIDLVFVERPAIPGPILRYLTEQSIHNREFNEKIGRDLMEEGFVLEAAVRGFPSPTLLTWGDHDRFCHVSGAEVLRGVLAKPTVIVLRNVGHVPMLERPQETAQGFLDFLGAAGS